MKYFVVHVELHHAESKDYANLREEMTEKGFSQPLLSNDEAQSGRSSAEYQFQGELTRAGVMELAVGAAAAVRRHYYAL